MENWLIGLLYVNLVSFCFFLSLFVIFSHFFLVSVCCYWNRCIFSCQIWAVFLIIDTLLLKTNKKHNTKTETTTIQSFSFVIMSIFSSFFTSCFFCSYLTYDKIVRTKHLCLYQCGICSVSLRRLLSAFIHLFCVLVEFGCVVLCCASWILDSAYLTMFLAAVQNVCFFF